MFRDIFRFKATFRRFCSKTVCYEDLILQKDKKRRLAVGTGLCGVTFLVYLARLLRERTYLDLELMVINRKLGSFA